MFSVFTPTDQELRRVFIGSSNTAPQIWNKPAGINFVSITCIGGGGGGGTGQSGSSGTSRIGGGGGGSAGLSTTIYPAHFVPEILYVVAGEGGPGGALPSSSGSESYVSAWSANTTSTAIRLCAAPGGLGADFTTPGGAVSAYNLASNCLLAGAAFSVFYGGLAGASGGVGNAIGGNVQALNNHILCAGAGGGGCLNSSNSGGSILTRGPAPAVAGGNFPAIIESAPPWAGYNGHWFWKPMMFGTGGAGGQGVNINTGGWGGIGAYGCGGGGGGGGTAGGIGGRGGAGLVIIECW